MYARIITSQLKPSHLDQAITIWNDHVALSLQHSRGFKGGYMTSDRHSGKGVIVTFWETEADATAVDSSGPYQHSIALFSDLLAAPPSRDQLEVFVQV